MWVIWHRHMLIWMMWTYVWYISQSWMISNIDLDKYMQCLALLQYENRNLSDSHVH